MTGQDVLVIDDNAVTRDTVAMILEGEGFSVQSCSSGNSAIDLAKERAFDVYVIDYSMPGIKGDEVTAEVRKLHPGSFIIGYSIEQKETQFLEAGADKFIIKDHLTSELVQSIKLRNPV